MIRSMAARGELAVFERRIYGSRALSAFCCVGSIVQFWRDERVGERGGWRVLKVADVLGRWMKRICVNLIEGSSSAKLN